MKTEILTTVDQFHGLREEWNALAGRVRSPEIFYRWEWSWFYYRHFRDAAPLFLVTVREGDRLVGLAPLCLTSRVSLGRHVRVLETIVGNMADYRNLLLDDETNRWRTLQCIVQALDEHKDDWDVIELRQMPSQDGAIFQLVHLLSAWPDMRHVLRIGCTTSTMRYASLHAKPDAKRLHRVRNKRAQLMKERRFTCRVGEADTDEFWARFLALHRARWPDSPLHVPEGRRLFADLRAHFGSRGELECSWLELDGAVAAMHFGFRDRHKVYYYMPVMSDAFRQDRVGHILTLAMVEHYARTHGEFDFLRGDEEYKLWWTDEISVNYRLRIYRRSSLAALADGLVPATKEYVRTLAVPGYLAREIRQRVGRSRH